MGVHSASTLDVTWSLKKCTIDCHLAGGTLKRMTHYFYGGSGRGEDEPVSSWPTEHLSPPGSHPESPPPPLHILIPYPARYLSTQLASPEQQRERER